ncbi:MAG: hypothetical protein JW841_06190 [Deltaproteobacteria bacterium]|nr:hypothetical protein [Deltaproteobacteria bacterium]
MSPAEIAKNEILALVAEINDDIDAIKKLLPHLLKVLSSIKQNEDPVQIMSAAGYLHHIYTAIESIHERIVRIIDGSLPIEERWHQELLTRVGVEVAKVRPAIISSITRARLARLLRFRHFFRHAYRIDFLAEEVINTASDIEETLMQYENELKTFCDHLIKAADDLN